MSQTGKDNSTNMNLSDIYIVKQIKAHKRIAIVAAAVLFITMGLGITTSVTHGVQNVDQVICEDGTAVEQPCKLVVNKKTIAVLDSREACEKVEQKLLETYKNDSVKDADEVNVVDVAFKEDVKIEEYGMKNYEKKPATISEEKALKKLKGTKKQKPAVTVVATYQVAKEKSYKIKPKTIETSKLYKGHDKVKEEGKSGAKVVTKTITAKNGKVLKTKKVNEAIVEEAEADVVLVGTKEKDTVFMGEKGDRSQLNFSCPLDPGYQVSSGYGYRWGALHEGVDMAISCGTPIHAAAGGKVVTAEMTPSYGNLVVIDHGCGVETRYAHCSSIFVSAGDTVTRGQEISAVGSTGDSTGNHLHFEIRFDGASTDPAPYIF